MRPSFPRAFWGGERPRAFDVGLFKWVEAASGDEWPGCPKCRAPITSLRLDAEFDAVAGAPYADGPCERTVRLALDGPRPAGITLTEREKRPGLEVARLERADAAYGSGLRVGDVLVCLDGAPCESMRRAVDHINAATADGAAVACTLLRPRRDGGGDDDDGEGAAAGAPSPRRGGGASSNATLAPAPCRVVEGGPSWRKRGDGVVVYALSCEDAAGPFVAEARFSKFREAFTTLDQRYPYVDLASARFPPRAVWRAELVPGFADRRATLVDRFVRNLLADDRGFAVVEGSYVPEADRMENAADVQSWLHHWLRRQEPDRAARARPAAAGSRNQRPPSP